MDWASFIFGFVAFPLFTAALLLVLRLAHTLVWRRRHRFGALSPAPPPDLRFSARVIGEIGHELHPEETSAQAS